NTYNGTTFIDTARLTLSKSLGTTAIPHDLVIGFFGEGAGTVTLNSNDQISDSATVRAGVEGGTFVTLDLNNHSDTIASLVLAGGSKVTTGTGMLRLAGDLTTSPDQDPFSVNTTATVSGNLFLASSSHTFRIDFPVDVDIKAVISGGPGTTADAIVKEGSRQLLLEGANTYTGVTRINHGTVRIHSNSALGSPAFGTVVSDGAALEIFGSGLSVSEPLTLFGSGVLNGPNPSLGALRNVVSPGTNTWTATITLGSDAAIGVTTGQLVVNAPIRGSFSLTKLGLNELDFGGPNNNSYGSTFVND